MLGYFFDGVASPRRFTHRVQRLTPPRHYQEWVDMLQPRLEYIAKDDDDRLLLPLKYPMSDPDIQSEIETGSEDYDNEKPDITPNPEQCTPQYDWQTHNPVVCNVVHEHTMALDRLDWHPQSSRSQSSGHYHHHYHHSNGLRRRRLQETTTTLQATTFPEHFRLLAHGYWRETWMMQSPAAGATGIPSRVAFKTLRYHHETTEYVLDKQRRDAVTSDRITSSRQSIHMYAYCGTSALYEYAPGGDLEKLLDRFEEPSSETGSSPSFVEYYSVEERFRLAYNATAALTDLHTTEGADRPTGIVHGDFKADQFVAVTPAVVDLTDANTALHKLPHFKLGDYNLARMVYWNKRGHHPCVIEPDGNGGTFRAPEEYAEEHGRTEKVDIYRYVLKTGVSILRVASME